MFQATMLSHDVRINVIRLPVSLLGYHGWRSRHLCQAPNKSEEITTMAPTKLNCEFSDCPWISPEGDLAMLSS